MTRSRSGIRFAMLLLALSHPVFAQTSNPPPVAPEPTKAISMLALSLTSLQPATVPVAIARFAQQYETEHAQMTAASVISTIPAVLLMFSASASSCAV